MTLAASFANLNLTSALPPIRHEATENASQWADALKGRVDGPFELSKTLLLRQKVGKTTLPVVVVALESTAVNMGALGKCLGLKELRFASDDLVNATFGQIAKSALSPFPLATSPNKEDLKVNY